MCIKKTDKAVFYNLFVLLLFSLLIFASCSKKEGEGKLLPDNIVASDLEYLSGVISEPLRLDNLFPHPLTADYKIETSLTIASKVTIMPGVRIEMGPNAYIHVTPEGSIRSMGTADSNVVFTGRQQNPGYWNYIMINSFDSINQFRHTVIEHAGGSTHHPAALILNGTAMIKFQHNTIRHSERYGLYLRNSGSRLSNFYNNSIEDCGFAPLYIHSTQINSIDSTSILDVNNVYNRIEVIGAEVFNVESWHKTNVPFYLTGATAVNSDVVIKPGARFIFGPAGRILVKETGSIYAVGTPTDSIYFSGTQNISGYWDCILFLSNNPYNEFKYVSIKHGGGYYYWNASIYLHDAFFKISYSTIANSARWGIYRNGIYNFENAGFNNFYNNSTGNIGP